MTSYRGRFAPSPTGDLHFGSLVAAVGSYLDARAQHGEWLVRIEDLDPPRTKPGAADRMLAQLDAYGFEWDGPVLYQSTRFDAYAEAVEQLTHSGALRECPCSRSALAALPQNATRPSGTGEDLFHPAECLPLNPASALGHALRLRVPAGPVTFADRSLGPQAIDVAATVGDFVLQRRDGLYAYQLAVVVDDAAQGITDVVRGCDLLASTARQVLLQRALGLPAVRYLHLPLAVDDRGLKLSKSGDAPAVGNGAGLARHLVSVLDFLGQSPPPALAGAALDEVWQWARDHWRVEGFAGCAVRAAPQEVAC
ncbi:MAG: tRNA glutamyl-Q(34) synthetase GluQRS [Gammaproteobacteria bacterium]|nr:tRNA glutamyl-Q(34) synthetase GluQRS [Gammaproteobacteria bacterium]